MSWLSRLLSRRSFPILADRVSRVRSVMGNDTMIQVYANNMAAGPCSACTALAANPVPLSLAPSGPLPSCPHPDQCALHWRTIYSPD